jgi:hypothetical protein
MYTYFPSPRVLLWYLFLAYACSCGIGDTVHTCICVYMYVYVFACSAEVNAFSLVSSWRQELGESRETQSRQGTWDKYNR